MLSLAYRTGALARAPFAIGASTGRTFIPPRMPADAVLKALRGAPGPPSNGAQTFVQASPSGTWTINHNLGYVPIVQVFSVGGMEIVADVQNPSLNQTVIYLAAPMAGSARLI